MPQEINQSEKFNITNNIGIDFKESELVFYFSASRKIYKGLSLGIRGGVYNFSENTADKIIDTYIAPIYPQLSPGYYNIHINLLSIQGITYIASFTGGYEISKHFSINAGIGTKFYRGYDYSATIGFSKIYQYETLPRTEYLNLSSLEPAVTKIVFTPYLSLGADYKLGRFNIGIFADNIYSAGISLGVWF